MRVEITNAEITPNPVNVNSSFIIKMTVTQVKETLDDFTFAELETSTFASMEKYPYE